MLTSTSQSIKEYLPKKDNERTFVEVKIKNFIGKLEIHRENKNSYFLYLYQQNNEKSIWEAKSLIEQEIDSIWFTLNVDPKFFMT